VIGPTLFLAYINDLPDYVNCNINLFADDTRTYQVVNNAPDKLRFQNNVHYALQQRASMWYMFFNVIQFFLSIRLQLLLIPTMC